MTNYFEIPGRVMPDSRTIVQSIEGEVFVRSVVDVIYEMASTRGEQPETTALPELGALRGDVPLSSPDKEMK